MKYRLGEKPVFEARKNKRHVKIVLNWFRTWDEVKTKTWDELSEMTWDEIMNKYKGGEY